MSTIVLRWEHWSDSTYCRESMLSLFRSEGIPDALEIGYEGSAEDNIARAKSLVPDLDVNILANRVILQRHAIFEDLPRIHALVGILRGEDDDYDSPDTDWFCWFLIAELERLYKKQGLKLPTEHSFNGASSYIVNGFRPIDIYKALKQMPKQAWVEYEHIPYYIQDLTHPISAIKEAARRFALCKRCGKEITFQVAESRLTTFALCGFTPNGASVFAENYQNCRPYDKYDGRVDHVKYQMWEGIETRPAFYLIEQAKALGEEL